MARRLMLAAPGLLCSCFHAAPYSAQHSIDTWRAMDASRSAEVASRRPATPSAGDVVDAQRAYELAVANNADLVTLAGEAEVAVATIRAARQLDNPTLRVTSFNIDDVIERRKAANIGLRVPIPRPGTLRTRAKGAQLAAEAIQGDVEDAKRELRGSIYRLFASLAMLTADLEQTERMTALQLERRTSVAARVEQAVATKLELAVADVDHARARDEQASVRESIALVEAELQRLTGVGVPLRFHADPDQLHIVELAIDRDALIERAMASRPGLRGGHANVGAAQAELHLARAEAYPWFDWAQLQYRAGPGSTARAWGFGIALILPVFSWNRGEIKAAEGRVRQREAEHRSRIATTATSIDESAARVERTAARVRELEIGLLPHVETAAREAEAALAARSIDPGEAYEILARGLEARRLHLATLLAHREAVIDLETAVGATLDADVDRP